MSASLLAVDFDDEAFEDFARITKEFADSWRLELTVSSRLANRVSTLTWFPVALSWGSLPTELGFTQFRKHDS